MLLYLAGSPVLPPRLTGAGGTDRAPPPPQTRPASASLFSPSLWGERPTQGGGGGGGGTAPLPMPGGTGRLWGAKALPGLGVRDGGEEQDGIPALWAGGNGAFFLPSVLVPRFHLRVGEVEGSGQLHPVLHAQVFLPLEAALQLGQLMVGEGGAGFTRLFQPYRGAVPGAGDLSVPFFFHWAGREEKRPGQGRKGREIPAKVAGRGGGG